MVIVGGPVYPVAHATVTSPPPNVVSPEVVYPSGAALVVAQSALTKC